MQEKTYSKYKKTSCTVNSIYELLEKKIQIQGDIIDSISKSFSNLLYNNSYIKLTICTFCIRSMFSLVLGKYPKHRNYIPVDRFVEIPARIDQLRNLVTAPSQNMKTRLIV